MNKALQSVVQEITRSLVLEMENHQCVGKSTSVSIIDLLLQRLAEEVVRQLKEVSSDKDLLDEDVEAKLEKVERKLAKRGITGEDEDKDEDEAAGTGSNFPNLKYAKPKYKNIESILKYVERDEDKGGVKLVIMNFND